MIPQNKAMTAAGWIVSALMGVMLIGMSAGMKFRGAPEVVEGMKKFGYQDDVILPLAVVEAGVTVVYLIPQTAVLGAVLLTGYLGGATATHVRIADPFYIPIAIGVLVWFGLWLRDQRIRDLLPIRRAHKTL